MRRKIERSEDCEERARELARLMIRYRREEGELFMYDYAGVEDPDNLQ